MAAPTKGQFVSVAVAAAFIIVVAANVVASFLVDEPLNWLPSVITAGVVGAFLALVIFRPRGADRRPRPQSEKEEKRTEFTIEARVETRENRDE